MLFANEISVVVKSVVKLVAIISRENRDILCIGCYTMLYKMHYSTLCIVKLYPKRFFEAINRGNNSIIEAKRG